MRKDKLLELWKQAVKLRSNYTCEHCGRNNNTLNALGKRWQLHSHHILTRRAYPNMKYDLDNGCCLCVNCHEFGKWSAKNTPIEFIEWLCSYKQDPEFYNKLKLRGAYLFKIDKALQEEVLKEMIKQYEKENKRQVD